MPPKSKPEKKAGTSLRPAISTSSLVAVPQDAVPGYEERIESGVPWNITELAFRHHTNECTKRNQSCILFSQAFQNKIDSSLLGDLMKESSLSLQEQFELLSIPLWENERFASDEARACFASYNCITDNLYAVVKEAVIAGDRQALLNIFMKKAKTLRLIDCKMTKLDIFLKEFKKVNLLNLACNYLEELDKDLLPECINILELQGNIIKSLENIFQWPEHLLYLGLSRNFITHESNMKVLAFSKITVLDLSENDICSLETLLETLANMSQLKSLALAGNPCSVCAGYAYCVLRELPRLRWLDWREVLPEDRPPPPPPPDAGARGAGAGAGKADTHPDDFRSGYFLIYCYRIMAVQPPPKPEKGVAMLFHLEVELPLLDRKRRQFLMHRRAASLTELLPAEEPDYTHAPDTHAHDTRTHDTRTHDTRTHDTRTHDTRTYDTTRSPSTRVSSPNAKNKSAGRNIDDSERAMEEEEVDIYAILEPKNPRLLINYTIFESAHIPWAPVMVFQEPVVRIFCPDLVALRNTFRTDITLRLVFTKTTTKGKSSGGRGGGGTDDKKKGGTGKSASPRQDASQVTVCAATCSLRAPDWSRKAQDFHWDTSLGSQRAVHYGEGELSLVQYNTPSKSGKGAAKPARVDNSVRSHELPKNLTCHFGFGVETVKWKKTK